MLLNFVIYLYICNWIHCYDNETFFAFNNRSERQYWSKLKNSTTNRIVFSNSGNSISNFCRTPENLPGQCTDVRNCIRLIFDLNKFRQSVCFKSLFIPGVCCPIRSFEFISDTNFIKPVHEQINFKLTTTIKPNVESSNYFNRFTRNSTKIIETTQTTEFSPFKDYITTEKNFFFFRPTLPTNTLNEIAESTTTNQENGVPTITSDVEKILSECGISGRDGRIVGGTESNPGQWPWMAAIFLQRPYKKKEFWCGGALINNYYVITAAHCLSDPRGHSYPPSYFTIRLGAHDISKVLKNQSESLTRNLTGTEYKISKLIAHPKFLRQGYYNDIGLMKLSNGPVEFNEEIHPICLPTNEDHKRDLKGYVATVLGYGTLFYGGPSSGSLRQVSLPIWSNEQCDRRYFQPINDGFLCAGFLDGGKDACQGDSGSPLMLTDSNRRNRWTIFGVVSFGNKCAQSGFPGVYTRITKFLNWIESSSKIK